ncbi:carbon-nitrogen hydrolase [Cloacibacterium rupense]|uniref:Carbon-nitrogen hydrolase n=1 Tax=Cloacibacterium rupense TaxID=517423 RepID=A0ABQ2NNY0_9FLAO|nr:amidohydrolase [Cloacibacterium rupense]GGP03854.1 carbon-nitrogen hydrolase [Cloacibacterium rupense]
MKIIGLNQNIIWKDKRANFSLIEEKFKNWEADLFLLPEMFSTGFYMKPDEVADEHQESLSWMISFAKSKNSAIAGSVSVKENDKFYNRFYFVKPDGSFHFYDKKHLFTYSGEDKVYTSGNNRVIVEYLGFRILLQVCFDARFPVFARNKKDYDVILYVANWPETRVLAWETLTRARAIENQAYVFALNRIGTDGNNLKYQESSHCFFADGSEISTKNEDFVFAELNLEKLQNFRKDFPFLEDADDFILK